MKFQPPQRFPQWAVVPDIRPWRDPSRTDTTPLAFMGGMSWSCFALAQFAADELRKRGVACYVELIY